MSGVPLGETRPSGEFRRTIAVALGVLKQTPFISFDARTLGPEDALTMFMEAYETPSYGRHMIGATQVPDITCLSPSLTLTLTLIEFRPAVHSAPTAANGACRDPGLNCQRGIAGRILKPVATAPRYLKLLYTCVPFGVFDASLLRWCVRCFVGVFVASHHIDQQKDRSKFRQEPSIVSYDLSGKWEMRWLLWCHRCGVDPRHRPTRGRNT